MSETRDSSPIPGNSPVPAALTARWHRHLARVEKALGRLDVDLVGSGSEADVLRAALDDLLAASRELETVERLVSQRLCDTGRPAAPRRRIAATGTGARRALVGAATR
ncbi:hypothetical protein G4X40_00565 [Rhodococcus sp. D2-41]|uniref:Uncharacterized protein n=1 Tax=Speluncibacter jeojiensis TaxID=2710754 RepID=A0A9X4LXL5_9ACTN|nr:hypothetical protein [Rhodococcus sp. D2-41]MDG3008639.1 hypothetical protein [Rhodococcus sp. D2-41]MDG3013154.1 hypothetical protein [Corynebacteriales bacterium D3-21]